MASKSAEKQGQVRGQNTKAHFPPGLTAVIESSKRPPWVAAIPNTSPPTGCVTPSPRCSWSRAKYPSTRGRSSWDIGTSARPRFMPRPVCGLWACHRSAEEEMTYNKHLVNLIQAFEEEVQATSLPVEVSRKLLSILGSLEYQVEAGRWPPEVVRHLQAAMEAWLDTLPAKTRRQLSAGLHTCVDGILAPGA